MSVHVLKLTHAPIHSFIYWLNDSLTHTHSFTSSLIHSLFTLTPPTLSRHSVHTVYMPFEYIYWVYLCSRLYKTNGNFDISSIFYYSFLLLCELLLFHCLYCLFYIMCSLLSLTPAYTLVFSPFVSFFFFILSLYPSFLFLYLFLTFYLLTFSLYF